MSARRRFSRRAVLIPLLLLAAMAWPVDADAAQLSLTWTDNSDNEDGFKIERKTGTGGTFAQIATVGPNVTSYLDSGLNSGTTYCYRVRAFNAAGDSAYSDEACGTPQDYALAVVKAGTGSGTVTSAPAGITCGTSCSGTYTSGTSVTLSASPASGSTFTGWSGGGCTGSGSCAVTVTATTTVTATFNAAGPLTLTSLTANRTAPQPPGTTITFTATATGGTAPYQYKWWVWNGAAWSLLQNWSATNTYAWTPATPNAAAQVVVWVRNATTAADTDEASGIIPFAVLP